MFVAMIIFNNLTLKHLTVSFYMVGRSLTTVANVVRKLLKKKNELIYFDLSGIYLFNARTKNIV